MSSQTIEIHALHTVPASCLNRDQDGSPKKMVYGGVQRARVSSQAWKHAIRDHAEQELEQDRLGLRSKLHIGAIAAQIQILDPAISTEQALAGAVEALKNAEVIKADAATRILKEQGKAAKARAQGEEVDAKNDGTLLDALLYLSRPQIHALAKAHLDGVSEKLSTAKLKKSHEAALRDAAGVDMALFGRMVANNKALNIDASCQVAHAMGVGAHETEFDFYTAVDHIKEDLGESSGGGMMGTIEFTSSTLYRFASLSVGALLANLGGDTNDAEAAVRIFIRSFCLSMPTGRSTSFANTTLPDAVAVIVRPAGQPVNASGAFLTPIRGEGPVATAAARLAERVAHIEESYGLERDDAFVLIGNPEAQAASGLGKTVTLTGLVDGVAGALRLAA